MNNTPTQTGKRKLLVFIVICMSHLSHLTWKI